MRLGIVDEDVRAHIEILDALLSLRMKILLRIIGAEGDKLARWMPTREHHRTAHLQILRLHPVVLALMANQGSTLLATDMQRKLIGIGGIGGMTIHTTARHLGGAIDGKLIKVGEATLEESLHAIELIARSHHAISDAPLLHPLLIHEDVKRLELSPLSVLLGDNSKGQFSAPIIT